MNNIVNQKYQFDNGLSRHPLEYYTRMCVFLGIYNNFDVWGFCIVVDFVVFHSTNFLSLYRRLT